MRNGNSWAGRGVQEGWGGGVVNVVMCVVSQFFLNVASHFKRQQILVKYVEFSCLAPKY